jgi:SET domain-containing protein
MSFFSFYFLLLFTYDTTLCNFNFDKNFSCSDQCQNRLIQKGSKVKLEIFKTLKKGWGVRAAENIISPLSQIIFLFLLLIFVRFIISLSISFLSMIHVLHIKRGTFVCEYIGEIITTAEAEERGKEYDKQKLSYLYDLGNSLYFISIIFTVSQIHISQNSQLVFQ